MLNDSILRMECIDKRFHGVHALDNFNFECKAGEVHVLMGENGAGKSTLLKILSGVHKADSGTIYINGEIANINTPSDAIKNGIAMIHQEIQLCSNMTISENIFRGDEFVKKPFRFVDYAKMENESQKLLDSLNMDIKANMLVKDLSIAQQQMTEIAEGLSRNAKILAMDEPSASLTDREIKALFDAIRRLTKQGVTIIYVSHRMNEAFEIGDRVTVMRDGKLVGTRQIKDTSNKELVEMMVGRTIENFYVGKRPVGGETLLEVKGFTNKKLKDVSFDVKKGEILGFSGLVGAGRTELARALFGLDKLESGEVYFKGKKIDIKCPQAAIEAGIGLIPEDRKNAGLILNNTLGFNLTITVLKKFIKGFNVNGRREKKIIDEYLNSLSIKTSGVDQTCSELSGGNQQKVVISKWLATEPELLIMDEPTRGIDVGAKVEIYELMHQLIAKGLTIIFISSDLPEIINLSSRIVVMHEGEVAGVIDAIKEMPTQVKIMHYATGGNSEDE